MKATRRKRAAGSRRRAALLIPLAASLAGCPADTASEADVPEAAPERDAEAASDHDADIAALVAYEEKKRASLEHARAPAWSRRAGPDPIALVREPGGGVLGLLRAGRVVRLDARGRTLAEADTLAGATDLVVVGSELVVVAEGDGRLDVLDAATLGRRRTVEVQGVASLRSAAIGAEHRIYLADPHRHRLLSLPWPLVEPAVPTEIAACAGALKVRRVGDWLAYACLLDHEVVVRRVDRGGTLGPPASIRHDGPIWSFDATPTEANGLRLVLGGVEDRPLDRSDGAFGWVDSYAFVVDAAPAAGDAPPRIQRRAAIDVAELGVVTPKHVAWQPGPEATPAALVTGYGGDRLALLSWEAGLDAPPRVRTMEVPPGIVALAADAAADGVRFVAADPLLDAWVVHDGAAWSAIPIAGADDRTPSERLGEALAFTTLMAPGATSKGKRSRFTCETCHFEGRVDGRVHFTGRGDVHATTKTLRGLFTNRPHFSRALDRTTAKMVDNEFRVASRGTGRDPWFSIVPKADAPWLSHLGVVDPELDAVELRRALVDFLAAFTTEPNPAVRGLSRFSDDAAEGARLFARHCESCHAARLVSDDPASRIPFAAWESLVLSESGPIVWGREERARTGVEPYVHRDGARVPSLRRLWVKRPYLTNGRARSLDAVLEGVRLYATPAHEEHRAVHGGAAAGEGRAPTADETRALRAFLDLL